jgi:predicted DNA-binding transcriptional regulator AlpA
MHPQEYAAVRAASQAQPIDDDMLLNSAQTRARVGGVSSMCIWRWMRDPKVQFPQPVRIGGKARNYWRLGDIRDWQTQRTQRTAA